MGKAEARAGKAETRAKLHAWWEGYEHAPGEKPAADAPPFANPFGK